MKEQERLEEQANDIRNDLSEIIMVLQDKADLQERVKQLAEEKQELEQSCKRTIKKQHNQILELQDEGKRQRIQYLKLCDHADRLEQQNKRYEEAIGMALSDIDDYDFESVKKGLLQALQNNREG
ncbi:hypothetical protein [Gracilibacillus dipsosauri]|uniref:Uncharacterized protein n=1 Tax=Gracilibacillus dipsosauri TaxID=178340 RepID=A0A317KTT6_9BACI|nr:hypothetical protein [Gracilibacillus dipsosauri]PWU66564.1 hypothetical protein DLJ74_19265 [Gracilibacillus dipsosauri]